MNAPWHRHLTIVGVLREHRDKLSRAGGAAVTDAEAVAYFNAADLAGELADLIEGQPPETTITLDELARVLSAHPDAEDALQRLAHLLWRTGRRVTRPQK